MAKTNEQTKYLIIGNSAGGIGAAEAIREVDRTGAIILISAEPYPAYSRPLISEYLVGERNLENMLFRPPDFYTRNNIQTVLGKTVSRLDTDTHTIELTDGGRLTWEKLLLATGGLPIVPGIKGMPKPGVFTFTTLDDAKAIDNYLNQVTRAVVIGGGLIGVSVTEALVRRGIKVTIVEMKDRVLNTILDEEASALEAEALQQSGVNVITNHTVTEIHSEAIAGETVSNVTLDDGSQVPCEMVVIAIGVRPRTELAVQAGLEINRGIIVDRHLTSSHPDVYACGDVAEAYDFIYDVNRLTPIWPNAYLGGRTAGFNMAGVGAEYPGGTAMNSLKYFGLDIVSAGIVSPVGDNCEMLSKKYDTVYRKVVVKDDQVIGMVFVSDIEKSGIVFSLMKEKIRVSGFKQALIADDFGLVSLPEKIWRSRLIPAVSSTAAVPAK
ncbi:MAG: FAD-dependent oxidoreductase [Dehalococcoidales bacterium]|nr:FAD-dependent oxidoreductase [Dehalococcoidales bacterium]